MQSCKLYVLVMNKFEIKLVIVLYVLFDKGGINVFISNQIHNKSTLQYLTFNSHYLQVQGDRK